MLALSYGVAELRTSTPFLALPELTATSARINGNPIACTVVSSGRLFATSSAISCESLPSAAAASAVASWSLIM